MGWWNLEKNETIDRKYPIPRKSNYLLQKSIYQCWWYRNKFFWQSLLLLQDFDHLHLNLNTMQLKITQILGKTGGWKGPIIYFINERLFRYSKPNKWWLKLISQIIIVLKATKDLFSPYFRRNISYLRTKTGGKKAVFVILWHIINFKTTEMQKQCILMLGQGWQVSAL